MSISTVCLIAVALTSADPSSSLPESAKRLTLRQAFQVQSARTTWYTDVDEARAESVKTGLPMVLHFEAKWCGACKTMSRRVLSRKAIRERLGREVIGVRVDADRYPQLIRRYHIAVLPSDVFVDGQGRILFQDSGYRSEAKYLAALDSTTAAGPRPTSAGNANVKLGKEALAETGERTNCVITRRSGVIVGLGGYSPVAMARNMSWVRGNRNYASVYQGVMYYMRDVDELRAFEQEPDKYAPKLHGCDPVVLSNHGTPLPGVITLGAFVDGNLYFFATEASRKLFKKNPSLFIKDDQLVSGEQLQETSYR